MCYGRDSPYISPKPPEPPAGLNISPSSKIPSPIISILPEMLLLCYIAETGNSDFTDGKMIFLSGSPELERIGGIPTGRLSGIVNHHIPNYLRRNQLPSYETNCIEDWETKLDKIVEETMNQDMTLISGIPPWMQMYFDRLIQINRTKRSKNYFRIFP